MASRIHLIGTAIRATNQRSLVPLGQRPGRNSSPPRKPLGRLAIATLLLAASSYGATAQLMTMPGSFGVSPGGEASYSIPIALPPGTAGLAPVLSLSYSSQGGDGPLGVGWSLDGLPSINRCARTFAQDGVHGNVNYDTNDRFCLQGQRLIAISGADGGDGTEYRTEIDSFSRIISHGMAGGSAANGPAWFEVHTKSGQILEFGNTPDSQVPAQNSTVVKAWEVNKVSDTKGNYFTVSYAPNPTGATGTLPSGQPYYTSNPTNSVNNVPIGQVYPVAIAYTGNTAAGLAPYNSVKFLYQSRPDITPVYQAGSLSQSTIRLSEVQTFAGSTLVSDYKLTYQQSPSTQRSRLTSIQLCPGDGSACLPPTGFAWSDVTLSFNPPKAWSPHFGTNEGYSDQNTYPRYLADVNGDGLPEIVGFAANQVMVARNTGSGFAVPTPWLLSGNFGTGAGWSDNNTYPRFLVDVNGDGLPDIVGFGAAGVVVWLSNGSSFSPLPTTPQGEWIAGFGTSATWTNNSVDPRFLADVNGDGLPDVVGIGFSAASVALNTGSKFALQSPAWITNEWGTAEGFSDQNTYPRFVVDVNGDGLADIVGVTGSGVAVSLSNGSSSFATAKTWIQGFSPLNGGWTDNNIYPRFLVDVNGDGLPDVVGFGTSGVIVALNTGKSFAAAKGWSPHFGTAEGYSDQNTYPRFLADVNGDGLPDIVGFGVAGAIVSLNTGTGFAAPQGWINAYGTAAGWSDNNTYPRFLTDVNGDGRADIVGFASGAVEVSTAAGSGIPDLLTTITSGLGAATQITYKPLTDPTVYSKDGAATVLPQQNLIAPIYVVAQVDANNGVGGLYSSSYAYAGARTDVSGRGFLGFSQNTVTDLQTNVTQTTTFRQDYPFIGSLAGQTKTITQTVNGSPVTKTLNQTTNSYSATPLSGSVAPTTYSQVFLTQSVAASSDLDGTALPTVTTSYQYDGFGNVTQLTTSTPDGASRVVTNTYTNDTTNWFLGRLTRATTTSTTP